MSLTNIVHLCDGVLLDLRTFTRREEAQKAFRKKMYNFTGITSSEIERIVLMDATFEQGGHEIFLYGSVLE